VCIAYIFPNRTRIRFVISSKFAARRFSNGRGSGPIVIRTFSASSLLFEDDDEVDEEGGEGPMRI